MSSAYTVLITGATGFVGSHLVEALAARDVRIRALVRDTSDVSLLERSGATLVRGSMVDPDALARAVAGVDVVFHLAALTHARSAQELLRVNAAGTRALIDAVLGLDARPRRVVYLSSLAAVGPAMAGRPVGPEDPPNPLTAYGRSKLNGERACLDAGGELSVAVLRAPAVYGPRDRELLRFFRYAARGVVPLPAGPDRWLQLVHVQDVAEALVRLADAPGATGIYHVAEPRAYTWTEVVDRIGRVAGRRPWLVRVPGSVVRVAAAASEWGAAAVGRATMFNRDKARELLAPAWLCETDGLARDVGFRARIELPEGLRETAYWYRTHGWL